MPSGIAFLTSRTPSRPPTPKAARAGGRVLAQTAVLKSVNSPKKTLGAVGTTLDAVGPDELVEHPTAIALLAKTMNVISDRSMVAPPFTQTQ